MKRCSQPNCQSQPIARSHCATHYMRWYRAKDRKPRVLVDPKKCQAPDCQREVYSRSYCRMHWDRRRRNGTVAPRVLVPLPVCKPV